MNSLSERRSTFTDPQCRRVVQRHNGQAVGVDPEQRDIGLAVAARHMGVEFAPVGRLDHHVLCVRHHVGVGQQDAAELPPDAAQVLAHWIAVAGFAGARAGGQNAQKPNFTPTRYWPTFTWSLNTLVKW